MTPPPKPSRPRALPPPRPATPARPQAPFLHAAAAYPGGEAPYPGGEAPYPGGEAPSIRAAAAPPYPGGEASSIRAAATPAYPGVGAPSPHATATAYPVAEAPPLHTAVTPAYPGGEGSSLRAAAATAYPGGEAPSLHAASATAYSGGGEAGDDDAPELAPTPRDLRLVPATALTWALTWWATGRSAPTVSWAAAVALVSALVALAVAVRPLRPTVAVRPAGPGVGVGGRLVGSGVAVGGRPAGSTVAVAVTLAAAVGAGALGVTGMRVYEREHDPLTRAAEAQQSVRFVGRVMTDPRRVQPSAATRSSGEPRWVVELKISAVSARHRTAASSGALVVIAGETWSHLVAGSHVRGSGRLQAGEPGDPAVAVTFPRSAPVVLDAGGWMWRTAERLRRGLREACRGLPPDARGLLPALVVGDTSRLDPGLKNDLQAAGLTHLTAVSGGNLAVVAAVAAALIAAAGGGRRLRVAGTLVVIAGFVVLARPEPSVLRAAVMGGLALLGLVLARPGAGVPVLSATSIVLLFLDPWLARSYGFALSVLATAGLLLLVPAWAARARRVPRAVVLAVAVPLAAQLATAPVTVLLNPVVSLVAVPANLLVAAAVAPATIAGVVAAAVSVVWPFGAHLAALVGGLATAWIALVAHRAAAVPVGSLPWPAGLAGAVLLTAVTVVGLILAAHRRWKTLAGCIAVVVLVVVVPRRLTSFPMGGARPPPDWAVVQCDVGQGSATLIRSGDDRAVLVDTGPDPVAMTRCLRLAGVRRLDLVLITHFHADHAGGIDGALAGHGSPPVFVSPLAAPDDETRRVTAAAARIGQRPRPVTAPVEGTVGRGADAVRWRLLPPPRSALTAATSAAADPEGTEVNNASVVMVAETRRLRIVALGDVEPEAQRPLLLSLESSAGSRPSASRVDVVVVAHHGSSRQDPALYRFLHPRVGLIGVGLGNDYGHPSPSALALLRQLGVRTLRTDTQGWVGVAGTPEHLRAVHAVRAR